MEKRPTHPPVCRELLEQKGSGNVPGLTPDTDETQGAQIDGPRSADERDLPVGFPLVGIVASAGGLDAFKRFFNAMPADSGMAFVLIPHLDPTHESLLVELLSKLTPMPVVEARQDMAVEINRVYIIPPGNYLAISQARLQLCEPPKQRGWQTSIDFFLRSLAQDQGERAIGIVLSGTGSHGALGVREIKLGGGMVMAQSPETAEYDQMPNNAIGTGLIDCILPPEQMPAALLKYIEQPYLSSAGKIATPSEGSADLLNQVFTLLHARTKYDFRSYRMAMVMRRIQRRMSLAHIDSIAQYLDFLQHRPEEATALYKDLLISVTAFFRDPQAYDVLEQELIPALIARKAIEVPIRVWVPGCATGEEAYSIAMLLVEGMAAAKSTSGMQIFASDIDGDAIEVARAGIYPASVVSDVSPERLERFFTIVDDNHYQIKKQLREFVIFSHQNVISDAPFSKLDFISCRNLLIYLRPEVQHKVIELFHFALVVNGFLLLGPSETIGRANDLFEAVSKKWRIYRRIGLVRRDFRGVPSLQADERRPSLPLHQASVMPRKSLKDLTEKLVLNEYAPAAALINRRLEVLYVTGPLVDYLEFPMGELTKELLSMARPGLRTKLRIACKNAIRDGKTVIETDVRVKRNGHYVPCSITVRPLTEPQEPEGMMLVTFQDRSPSASFNQTFGMDSGSSTTDSFEVDDSPLVQQLEFELKSMSEELHSTIEEMESSNEELKTSNEEIMSINEELQSANEELETSKEELQSLNEELSTVNSQLQDKVEDLDKATADLMNLISSTEICSIFLDEKLHITRFTPPTNSLLNLLPSDVGRPFRDIAPKFADETMLSECQLVLDKLTPVEREIETDESRHYLRRILPYRTMDQQIGGVVITFIDLTQRKLTESAKRATDAKFVAALQESAERMEVILDTAADAIITLDQQGKIESVNRATETLFSYVRKELVGQHVSIMIPSLDSISCSGTIENYLENGRAPFIGSLRELIARRKDDVRFPVDISIGRIDHLGLYTVILRDISDRKKLQSHILEIASEEQRRIGQELHDGTQQELTGLSLYAGTLSELLNSAVPSGTAKDPAWKLKESHLERLKQTAAKLVQGLAEANQHVRVLSHGIMPVQIDADGLRSALAELAAATVGGQQINCRVEFSGSVSVASNLIATQLYRIAQESLNNALHHGQANKIIISLLQQDGQIILEICDNGIGFDSQQPFPGKGRGGMGLRSMEYRASLLGGALQVVRNSGPGTTVRCIIPTTEEIT
jgi:two-component system, chemotaxis family, CheB/CheR fusion protein